MHCWPEDHELVKSEGKKTKEAGSDLLLGLLSNETLDVVVKVLEPVLVIALEPLPHGGARPFHQKSTLELSEL